MSRKTLKKPHHLCVIFKLATGPPPNSRPVARPHKFQSGKWKRSNWIRRDLVWKQSKHIRCRAMLLLGGSRPIRFLRRKRVRWNCEICPFGIQSIQSYYQIMTWGVKSAKKTHNIRVPSPFSVSVIFVPYGKRQLHGTFDIKLESLLLNEWLVFRSTALTNPPKRNKDLIAGLMKGNQWVSRWWFQTFLIFTSILRRFPFWLILFKWVETTN